MARFFKATVTYDDGSVHEVEMIGLPANGGADEATRPATDEDRMLYNADYFAYKNPPVDEEPADLPEEPPAPPAKPAAKVKA